MLRCIKYARFAYYFKKRRHLQFFIIYLDIYECVSQNVGLLASYELSNETKYFRMCIVNFHIYSQKEIQNLSWKYNCTRNKYGKFLCSGIDGTLFHYVKKSNSSKFKIQTACNVHRINICVFQFSKCLS